MHVPPRPKLRAALGAVAAFGVVVALAACAGGSDSATTTSTGPEAGSSPTTTSSGTGSSAAISTTSEGGGATTATTVLEGASTAQRSAPADGTGTALLTAVRIGRHDGFERIAFEFEGDPLPGYRVQWVDGPITADGSGEPVNVDGDARLEIVLQPASGVDLSATDLRITYAGPDRIATEGQTELLTDLVRTGDFEAVLTWVAGTSKQVPFRVTTLRSPTRLAIDLAT